MTQTTAESGLTNSWQKPSLLGMFPWTPHETSCLTVCTGDQTAHLPDGKGPSSCFGWPAAHQRGTPPSSFLRMTHGSSLWSSVGCLSVSYGSAWDRREKNSKDYHSLKVTITQTPLKLCYSGSLCSLIGCSNQKLKMIFCFVEWIQPPVL